ncbi:MAG: Trm112 family protein [Phycisphaerae bacterium]|nr:Trm112 family protein [Tepidisphaeraceae bacterium]
MSSTPPSSADNSSAAANKPVDPELLAMLRCPLTHSRLRAEGDFLVAEVGGLRYPVREGIPVMLVEEAQLPAGVLSLEEFKQKFAAQVGERK